MSTISPFPVITAASIALALWLSPALGEPVVSLEGHRAIFDQLDTNRDGRLAAEEVTADNKRLFNRLVRLADEDSDGMLNSAEFAKGMTPQTPGKPIEQKQAAEHRGADAMRLVLLKLDANRDTRLTRDEAPEKYLPAFDRLVENADRNRDGELDRAELSRGGPRLARNAEQITRRLGIDVDRELKRLVAQQGEEANRFDRTFNPMQDFANPKQVDALFRQLDTNRDNRLVVDELPEQLQDRVGRLLRRADVNGDGGVSKREFMSQSERLAAFLSSRRSASPQTEMKKNEQTEMRFGPTPDAPSLPAPGKVARRLTRKFVARLDKNGDGVVTRDEAQGKMAKRFSLADTNQNGRLDAPEIDAVTRQMERRLRNADRRAEQKTQ